MRYQVLKVISVSPACVYVFVWVPVCVLSSPRFVCVLFFNWKMLTQVVSICYVRSSMTANNYDLCSLSFPRMPFCHGNHGLQREQKVWLLFLHEYKYITWGYLLPRYHLENWLWMCKDPFLFLPLSYNHMFVCNSYLPPHFTLFSHILAAGVKDNALAWR